MTAMTSKLSSNEQEAANRAEATALLIRTGYRVYRPEADVHGEDLVLRNLSGDLLPMRGSAEVWREGHLDAVP